MLKTVMLRSSLIALACALSVTAHAYAADPKRVDVPAGDLTTALEALAKQSGVELVYQTDQLKGLRTQGVTGNFSLEEAVTKLLEGTKLTLKTDTSGAMLIALPRASSNPETPEPGSHSSRTPPVPQADEAFPPLPTGEGQGEGIKGEGKGKGFWSRFRLAQADTASKSDTSNAEGPNSPESSQKRIELEEIVITGSHLVRSSTEGAQDVQIYDRESIERSGQSTVSSFLNTLSSVALSTTENETVNGNSTTVRLRGLPFGTTLVLINGRRVETSGIQARFDFFDLNNIPIAAVERIEVVADGSSAIYGSDAIAGVVNIVLRKDISGAEATAQYGDADGSGESMFSLALGRDWDRANVSLISSYQKRNRLNTSERSITASNDYRAFGGPDNNFPTCSPGNVFGLNGATLPGSSVTFAGVSGNVSSGRPALTDFNYGTLNKCPIVGAVSVLPETDRLGFFAQGRYEVMPSFELFAEVLYSDVRNIKNSGLQILFGTPTFQLFRVPAANPFNPFGADVGITAAFSDFVREQTTETEFWRPLVGARGQLPRDWRWELSAYSSEDRSRFELPDQVLNSVAVQNALNSTDPNTALNPFVAPLDGPTSLLESFFADQVFRYMGRDRSVGGLLRGSAFELPSGSLALAIGSEYHRTSLTSSETTGGLDVPSSRTHYRRSSYAVFSEARIPILGRRMDSDAGERLALTIAGRLDHTDDFGSTTNPQLGVEWRPTTSLLARATYAEAFKAPPLTSLFTPITTTNNAVTDPASGGQRVLVPVFSGGNPDLQPLTGESHSFGIVYMSEAIPGLSLAATQWNVREDDAITNVGAQFIIDNEASFPERVTRNTAGAVTSINNTLTNFGYIEVEGVDYHAGYRGSGGYGSWVATLNVTQTYKYRSQLVAGAAVVDGVSRAQSGSGNWAPRWKGALTAGWSRGPFSVNLGGRYIGDYMDYGSTTREIGNFWLADGNFQVDLSPALPAFGAHLKRLSLEVGGVNLFNSLPQYSNYNTSFTGYDPSQADIRGRFLYARIGMQF